MTGAPCVHMVMPRAFCRAMIRFMRRLLNGRGVGQR